MKKFYFLALILFSATAFAQNSVVITRVIDGTLPHGGCNEADGNFSPRIVEMYVTGTIDFNNYRLQAESNGAANQDAINWSNGHFLFGLGEVTDAFVYSVNIPEDFDTGNPFYEEGVLPIFTEMYPDIPENRMLISKFGISMNGNDAIRLAIYNGDNLVEVVDQFGNPFDVTDGSDFSAAWAYRDSYASRNNGLAANGGNFDASTFNYGGNDDLDNATCAEFIDAVGLGTFSTLSTTSFDAIAGLTMYPNPLSGNILNITSATNATKAVAIYDVLGKQVINTTVANQTVNVANLTTGVYIVKITEEGKTATRKLVVK
ncbi:T9SS type A sorting domain-containing protein [Flavobacterium litorale]|uniref:T9SS type A sorting domain-containing protein n=1 Tax=Flavobacterium litorale TaxID=2856519 RepID=A0ABX8VFB4_9FLAO|nr:T9SS type A sorting domain-containing protein [Flavobacterium litorale]QYJ69309.1 T9SS type A sorting domain-containing protein [Flavobacterium litorale]